MSLQKREYINPTPFSAEIMQETSSKTQKKSKSDKWSTLGNNREERIEDRPYGERGNLEDAETILSPWMKYKELYGA